MTTPAATIPAVSKLGFTSGLTLSLDVSDYERSKRWYQDVLGFRVTYELPEYGWCEFETPTQHFTIGLSSSQEVKVNGGMVPTFNVKDIAQTRNHLEASHVKFDGPTRELPGLVKLATFFDPDGHPFMLAESLMPQG